MQLEVDCLLEWFGLEPFLGFGVLDLGFWVQGSGSESEILGVECSFPMLPLMQEPAPLQWHFDMHECMCTNRSKVCLTQAS